MSHLNDLRAEALFCSPLQPSMNPCGLDVRILITASLARFSETQLTAMVAQEFGDHPELAAARMRWALTASVDAFAMAEL